MWGLGKKQKENTKKESNEQLTQQQQQKPNASSEIATNAPQNSKEATTQQHASTQSVTTSSSTSEPTPTIPASTSTLTPNSTPPTSSTPTPTPTASTPTPTPTPTATPTSSIEPPPTIETTNAAAVPPTIETTNAAAVPPTIETTNAAAVPITDTTTTTTTTADLESADAVGVEATLKLGPVIVKSASCTHAAQTGANANKFVVDIDCECDGAEWFEVEGDHVDAVASKQVHFTTWTLPVLVKIRGVVPEFRQQTQICGPYTTIHINSPHVLTATFTLCAKKNHDQQRNTLGALSQLNDNEQAQLNAHHNQTNDCEGLVSLLPKLTKVLNEHVPGVKNASVVRARKIVVQHKPQNQPSASTASATEVDGEASAVQSQISNQAEASVGAAEICAEADDTKMPTAHSGFEVEVDLDMTCLLSASENVARVATQWWSEGVGKDVLQQELHGFVVADCAWRCPNLDVVDLCLVSANLRVDWEEANTQNPTKNTDKENNWTARKALAVNQLRKLSPAVVGTQEGLNKQLLSVTEALGFERVGVSRRGNLFDEFSAILYDPLKVTLLENATEWLSDTPDVVGSISWDSSLPRIVTWARERARIHSAKHLIDLAKRLAVRFGEIPIFVTGDFNATKTPEETWSILTAPDTFHDSWQKAKLTDSGISRGGSFHGFLGVDGSNPWNGQPDDSLGHIDWILFRAPAGCNTDVVVETTKLVTEGDEKGVWPSDHFFVCSEFKLLPKLGVRLPRVASRDKVDVTLTINSSASSVFVIFSQDRWLTQHPMTCVRENVWQISRVCDAFVPFQFKFCGDGTWFTAVEYATHRDGENTNNSVVPVLLELGSDQVSAPSDPESADVSVFLNTDDWKVPHHTDFEEGSWVARVLVPPTHKLLFKFVVCGTWVVSTKHDTETIGTFTNNVLAAVA